MLVSSKILQVALALVLLGTIVMPVLAYDSVVTLKGSPACDSCNCQKLVEIQGVALQNSKYEIGSSGKFVTISDITTTSGGDIIGFTWSSDLPVNCVIVKGGPGANKFVYNTAATSDSSILYTYDHYTAPSYDYAVSDVLFCGNEGPKTNLYIEIPEFPLTVIPFLFLIGFGIVLVSIRKKTG